MHAGFFLEFPVRDIGGSKEAANFLGDEFVRIRLFPSCKSSFYFCVARYSLKPVESSS